MCCSTSFHTHWGSLNLCRQAGTLHACQPRQINCQLLARLLQQAFGLGKIGDRVRRIKTMYKDAESPSKNKPSSGVCGFLWDKFNPVVQFIPPDKLESQNIRRSTLR